jgi:hypothetical protein
VALSVLANGALVAGLGPISLADCSLVESRVSGLAQARGRSKTNLLKAHDLAENLPLAPPGYGGTMPDH